MLVPVFRTNDLVRVIRLLKTTNETPIAQFLGRVGRVVPSIEARGVCVVFPPNSENVWVFSPLELELVTEGQGG